MLFVFLMKYQISHKVRVIFLLAIYCSGKFKRQTFQVYARLGSLNELEQIVKNHDIEEVIIAVEPSEHKVITEILSLLDDTSIDIKIIADYKDILAGSVKMNSIFTHRLFMFRVN